MNKALHFSRLMVLVTVVTLTSFSGLSAYFFGNTAAKPKTINLYNATPDTVQVLDLEGNMIAVLQANSFVIIPEPGLTVTDSWMDSLVTSGGYVIQMIQGNKTHRSLLKAPCTETSYDIEYGSIIGLKTAHIPLKSHKNFTEVLADDPAQEEARESYAANLPMIQVYNASDKTVNILDLNGNTKVELAPMQSTSLPKPEVSEVSNWLDKDKVKAGYSVRDTASSHTAILMAPCDETTYKITFALDALKIEHAIDETYTGYTHVPAAGLYGTTPAATTPASAEPVRATVAAPVVIHQATPVAAPQPAVQQEDPQPIEADAPVHYRRR